MDHYCHVCGAYLMLAANSPAGAGLCRRASHSSAAGRACRRGVFAVLANFAALVTTIAPEMSGMWVRRHCKVPQLSNVEFA
jgi:hypothetical protein